MYVAQWVDVALNIICMYSICHVIVANGKVPLQCEDCGIADMYTRNPHVLILPHAGQPGCPCVGYLCGVPGPAPSFGGMRSVVNTRPVHKLRLIHDFKHRFLQPQ